MHHFVTSAIKGPGSATTCALCARFYAELEIFCCGCAHDHLEDVIYDLNLYLLLHMIKNFINILQDVILQEFHRIL